MNDATVSLAEKRRRLSGTLNQSYGSYMVPDDDEDIAVQDQESEEELLPLEDEGEVPDTSLGSEEEVDEDFFDPLADDEEDDDE